MCRERIATKDVFGTALCKKCWKKVKGNKAQVMVIDKNNQVVILKSKEKLDEILKIRLLHVNTTPIVVCEKSVYWNRMSPFFAVHGINIKRNNMAIKK